MGSRCGVVGGGVEGMWGVGVVWWGCGVEGMWGVGVVWW